MGFGYLLYGFMMLLKVGLTVNSEFDIGIDIFPDLAGFLFMFAASRRLKDYDKAFTKFELSLVPLIALSLAGLVGEFMGLFGINPSFAAKMIGMTEYIRYPLEMLALIIMLTGIRNIAYDVGHAKIEKKSKIASFMCIAFYLLKVLVRVEGENTLFGISSGVLSLLALICEILWYVFLVYTFILLFDCYMFICREGDEDMDNRKAWHPVTDRLKKLKENSKK